MEENLAESGVDIGDTEVIADEKIPSDQEIETLENAVEIETNQNENVKILTMVKKIILIRIENSLLDRF